LSKDDTVSISPGKAVKKQTIALMAPGTGLGQSLLVWVKDRYKPVPSEGGHADFAPTTEEEVLLWRYLYKESGHVSIERVASGPGLINIYSWLRTSGKNTEPQWLKRRMKTSDPAAVIAQTALDEEDSICMKALDCFISILGSVAGNLALTGFARGGVYLGGGIPPKILPKLKENTFRRPFVKKGRFKKFLEKIPVHVILNEKAALLGAAYYAERLVK
jgi:glucokinase